MAVKTRDEILTAIKDRLGDDTSDEALNFIEDVTDTLNDYESRTSGESNWKKKYEDNDKMWRQKYKDRFFNTSGEDASSNEDDFEEEKKPMTFDDLFDVKE